MIAQILVVMIAAIYVTIIAERRNIQAPLLLALIGLAASFLPRLTRLELEPEVILTVVLPPLLFSAASEFSFVSFLKRLPSIFNLGVLLVIVTTGFVGLVTAAIMPGVGIAAAMVLAAVVSPPDAVTATAIGRKLGLPKQMMTVLKGESLINDAAALTLFSFAAAAVAGTQLFISNITLYLLYSAVAGIAVGVVIGALVHRIRMRLSNPSMITMLSVLVPFTAYLLAEELGASGVLAVVAAGFSLGHNASESNYAARIQERQFWKTLDALLEAFVFAYIGLQLRFVFEDALEAGFELWSLLGTSAVVLLAVIAIRIAWIFATGAITKWRHARTAEQAAAGMDRWARDPRRAKLAKDPAFQQRLEMTREFRTPPPPFSWRENLVLSWTGMRGVVTLAAAAGVPLVTAAGEPFPGREAIQVIAFVVTLGTLLVQGLTLPWLIRRLGISDPQEAAKEAEQHDRAETISRTAAVEAMAAFRDRQQTPEQRKFAEMIYDRMSRRQDDTSDVKLGPEQSALMLEAWMEMMAARRGAVIAARDAWQLDDETMREVLEQMDLEQAVMSNWKPERIMRG